MKNTSDKENKKVKADKKPKDHEVKEGKPNSINDMGTDDIDYPHKDVREKQYNNQAEFIDRNSDSKDKS
jgi:hypothetical protein